MRAVALLAVAVAMSGCSEGYDRKAYTLYRSSIAGSESIHVATFDSTEGAAFNQQNCSDFAILIRSQPGVTVRYWCEPGRLSKR